MARKNEMERQLEKQTELLLDLHKSLNIEVKKEIKTAIKQIEASVILQNYFSTGVLSSINVERQGWPTSSDFNLYMVMLMEQNKYDLIIEFGSGISTVIIARTLEKMARRRRKKSAVKFVSFEHQEYYYKETYEKLAKFGLQKKVRLQYAPLRDWLAPDGSMRPYYACQAVLADVSGECGGNKLRALVVVDGPPTGTAKHARYPAGPLVLKYFSGASIDILMDDYARNDEKEIVEQWLHHFSAKNVSCEIRELDFEKGACLLEVNKK